MKIEIWSDYACPYCYIAKSHLKKVLSDLNIKDVNFIHRVFMLEPGKANHPERTYLEGLNLSEEKLAKLKKIFAGIADLAKEAGLNYSIEGVPDVGTIDAHRLTLWAEEKNAGAELEDLIFHAYYIENKDISDHDVLLGFVDELGLNHDEAAEVLNSKAYMDRVFDDAEMANALEIDLVPHVFINDDHEVVGVINEKQMKIALQEAISAKN